MVEDSKVVETDKKPPRGSLLDSAKAFVADLSDRLNGPLIGPVGISWLCWNIKAVWLAVSSLPILDKFEYLEANYYQGRVGLLRAFVGPLASAIAYLVFYPRIGPWAYGKILDAKVSMLRQQRELLQMDLITKGEAQALERKIQEQEMAHQKEAATLRRENEALKKLNQEKIDKDAFVDPEARVIASCLNGLNQLVSAEDLAKESGFQSDVVRRALAKLVTAGWVTRFPFDPPTYALSGLGMTHLG